MIALQVIFTSGSHYNLDDDVDESIVSRLKAMLVSNTTDRFTLVPYAGERNDLDISSWLADATCSRSSCMLLRCQWHHAMPLLRKEADRHGSCS